MRLKPLKTMIFWPKQSLSGKKIGLWDFLEGEAVHKTRFLGPLDWNIDLESDFVLLRTEGRLSSLRLRQVPP